MSARLAAADGGERDDHRSAGRGACLRRKETVSLTGEYTVRRPDRFHSKMTGGRGLESWYNGKTLTIAVHATRSSRRRRCPRPSTARWTRWPSATTWRCRWAICSTAPRKRRCSPTRPPAATPAPRTSATRPAVPPGVQGHRRRLGALAAGAGRAAAEAVQGRAEGPQGPAGGRRDVHGLESRAADQRRHVRPEGAGGLRGHRHPAARRGGQGTAAAPAAEPAARPRSSSICRRKESTS